MWLLGMEKMNGLRLQHFLKEKEGTESFKEIPIIRADSDLKEFEATRQKVLGNVIKNVEKQVNKTHQHRTFRNIGVVLTQ